MAKEHQLSDGDYIVLFDLDWANAWTTHTPYKVRKDDVDDSLFIMDDDMDARSLWSLDREEIRYEIVDPEEWTPETATISGTERAVEKAKLIVLLDEVAQLLNNLGDEENAERIKNFLQGAIDDD